MLRRIVPSACGLAALPLAITKVYAAEDVAVKDDQAEIPEPTSSRDNLINVRELPLYGDPVLPELVYEHEKQTAFHHQVARLRRAVWQDVDKVAGTVNTVQEGYGTTKQYGKDVLKYLREDSGAFPRAVFITVSGLGGIVAGYKGGFLRKTFLASAGLVTSASICYPHQAVDIARVGWVRTSEEAKKLWQQARDNKPTPSPEADKVTTASKDAEQKDGKPEVKPDTKSESGAKDEVKVASKSETAPKEKAKKDFGMSKAEDKDMYSTRSS